MWIRSFISCPIRSKENLAAKFLVSAGAAGTLCETHEAKMLLAASGSPYIIKYRGDSSAKQHSSASCCLLVRNVEKSEGLAFKCSPLDVLDTRGLFEMDLEQSVKVRGFFTSVVKQHKKKTKAG